MQPRGIAILLAGLKVAIHLTALTAYGWFRDELYYLVCARRLALGYVDHPPLSMVVLRAWTAVFGESLTAVRLVSPLAGAGTVLLTAAAVRELGGGSVAVLLAGLAVVTAPGRLGMDHHYSMNTLDALLWALAGWLTLRALRAGPAPAPVSASAPASAPVSAPAPAPASVSAPVSASAPAWVALGAALGLGVLDKWSVLWLCAGLAVGLLLVARSQLRSRWPWLGALLAIALTLPHFVWQATHGWPTLEFIHNAMADKYVRMAPGAFLRETILLAGPASVPLWVAGSIAPFAIRDQRRARVTAIAFAVTVAIVAASRGKPEYLLVAFPLVLAPGAVAVERWSSSLARPRWTKRAVVVLLAAGMCALAAVALPIAIPVLSVDRFVAYQAWLGLGPETTEKKELGRLPQHYADMHGWHELVDAAAAAYEQLTPDERAGAVVWTVSGGYGSAAAIDVLGRRRGLPRAVSGHNNYWLWGWQPSDGRAVVVLGGHPRLGEVFEELTLVGRVQCGDCMPYENDKPVYIGRRMRRSFADIWPLLKRYE